MWSLVDRYRAISMWSLVNSYRAIIMSSLVDSYRATIMSSLVGRRGPSAVWSKETDGICHRKWNASPISKKHCRVFVMSSVIFTDWKVQCTYCNLPDYADRCIRYRSQSGHCRTFDILLDRRSNVLAGQWHHYVIVGSLLPQHCPRGVFLMVLMATLTSLTELTTMLILTTKRVRLWLGGEGFREASDDDAGPVRAELYFKHAVFSQNSRLLRWVITRKVKAKRAEIAPSHIPGLFYFAFSKL